MLSAFCTLVADTASSYHPANTGFFPDAASHPCDAVFYRLGTDEGTVERMYKKTAGEIDTAMAADKLYDGVVLIRIKFMVQLDPTPLPLLIGEIDESILRYAMGRPTFKEDPATHAKTLLTTLDVADMQPLADRLHTMLADDAAPLRKARST